MEAEKSTFASGIAWRMFETLENELLDIIRYVPLDSSHAHDNVYSVELLNLLLNAGTAVDTIFKHMLKFDKLDSDEKVNKDDLREARTKVEEKHATIEHFRKVFEPYYELSTKKVQVGLTFDTYDLITPFSEFSSNSRIGWWDAYTKVKHNAISNLKEATLRNVVESISALFLLNVVHIPNRSILVALRVIRSDSMKEYGEVSATKLTEILERYPREVPVDILSSQDVFVAPVVTKPIFIGNIWARSKLFTYIFPRQQGLVDG